MLSIQRDEVMAILAEIRALRKATVEAVEKHKAAAHQAKELQDGMFKAQDRISQLLDKLRQIAYDEPDPAKRPVKDLWGDLGREPYRSAFAGKE